MNYLHTETNRELSKLMAAKGCKSESGYYWWGDREETKIILAHKSQLLEATIPIGVKEKGYHPAFDFEDCVRPDNARIVWGDEFLGDENSPIAWEYHTHKLLEAFQSDPTGERWMQLIIQQLKV